MSKDIHVSPIATFEHDGELRRAGGESFDVSRAVAAELRANRLVVLADGTDGDSGEGEAAEPVVKKAADPSNKARQKPDNK